MKGVAIALIVLIVLIVAGAGGAYWYVETGKPQIISASQEDAKTCSDSDGADIYTKGYLTWTQRDPYEDEDAVSSSEDICDYYHPKTKLNVGLVRDSYCEGRVVKTQFSTCGRGFICRDGRCLRGDPSSPICSDSDDGKNVRQRGKVESLTGSHEDYCWITTPGSTDGASTADCSGANCYVEEGFCDGQDIKGQEKIPCPTGCSNGICS